MKYKVKGTDIEHNGARYPEGEEIELTDKEAKGLEVYLTKIGDSPDSTTPLNSPLTKGETGGCARKSGTVSEVKGGKTK